MSKATMKKIQHVIQIKAMILKIDFAIKKAERQLYGS